MHRKSGSTKKEWWHNFLDRLYRGILQIKTFLTKDHTKKKKVDRERIRSKGLDYFQQFGLDKVTTSHPLRFLLPASSVVPPIVFLSASLSNNRENGIKRAPARGRINSSRK